MTSPSDSFRILPQAPQLGKLQRSEPGVPLLSLMDAEEVESTLEGAKGISSEKALGLERLEELPTLPFVNKYRIGKYYYKRKCYDEYYTLVKRMLDEEEEECVTVTGTPGIGKSIFYAYLFLRFRKEMKEVKETDTWIIAAAYEGGKILRAFAFKDNDDDKELLMSEEEINDFIRAASKEKKRVLVLCDGPPDWRRGGVQTVVFTSPNDGWMERVRKHDCTLYMPLWTLTELQEAAKILDLKRLDGSDITKKDMEERYYAFGGAARECFYVTEKLVEKKRYDLIKKIGQIVNLRDVRILLRKNENAAVCHRLLQFVAEHGDLIKTDLASPFVAEQLEKRMLEVEDGDWEKLRKSLEDFPELGEQFLATPPPQTENNQGVTSEPNAPTAVSESSHSPARLRWLGCLAILLVVFLSEYFGFQYNAKKVIEPHEFSDEFEKNRTEYWEVQNEIERFTKKSYGMTEEEVTSLLAQLKTIQVDMEKWLKNVWEDVVQFQIYKMEGHLPSFGTVNEPLETCGAFDTFKENTAELHQKLLKLDKDYAIWRSKHQIALMVQTKGVEEVYASWSEKLHKVSEELSMIQPEMQKWQKDMKEDFVQLRQALSVSASDGRFLQLLTLWL